MALWPAAYGKAARQAGHMAAPTSAVQKLQKILANSQMPGRIRDTLEPKTYPTTCVATREKTDVKITRFGQSGDGPYNRLHPTEEAAHPVFARRCRRNSPTGSPPIPQLSMSISSMIT